ncbi:GNAT family N-acetyltransferase [Balneola vulgaris]|uniref:GNAT family N-acetyltransferase n=1 Tax=Balneola vulgaris TaxID=287535 RepID=UPI000371BFEA|nr:GNAT family N-acetyltransferase [Balneola vulgaris]
MNTNGVTIVTTDDERKKFIEFPYGHYADNDVWVPPLRMDQKKLIDTKKNPYYDNAEIALFIAEHNGEIAGRISAVVDHRFNKEHNSKTGHFGFFECIDDQNTADLLFRVACDWLKEKGMTDVLGPASPGMMDTIGLLVDGFDKQPYLMMPYNKPYYEKLILGAGFEHEMDLLAYVVDQQDMDMSRFERALNLVYKRYPGLKIREVNKRKLNEEVEIVRQIYNQAWKDNWGFLPLTKAELQATAEDFKLILDTDFAHIAEIDGKPVAFSIALLDYNQLFKTMNGNLFPFGFLKILFQKKKITRLRTALLGVIPEYKGKGIDAILTQKAIEKGIPRNLTRSELSWVLGTNTSMIRLAEKINGRLDKTYRMYRKQL